MTDAPCDNRMTASAMKVPELKPCPFCGSQKTDLVADSSRCKVAFRVSCAECHAGARVIKRDGKPDYMLIREAYTSWNMRASDSEGAGQ